jgi:2-oxo-4-hydroxy-4-carboxy-5-ureidoimidazoline decarboxylase
MRGPGSSSSKRIIAIELTRKIGQSARVPSLDDVNRWDHDTFTRVLGGVFESSPWVAERAWLARPFGTVTALHAAMCDVVRRAPAAERVELLRAHPDLAGKAARAGEMSAASASEQAAAGLDRLSEAEFARFERLNVAYRERFGFPFIIAVRRHDATAILDAFERRLSHTQDEEIDAALAQVFDITGMRLHALVTA